MSKNNKRIGLALSGGGLRAAIFHLGVLSYLAEEGRLEEVAAISTVSGASLGMSLVFSENGFRWPTSSEFLHWVLPASEEAILNHDISNFILKKKTVHPDADAVVLLAQALEEEWGVHGNLRDLYSAPRWEIGATAFETGENFHFSHARMGDRRLGYALQPDFLISHAVAASGAYPELIGEYLLDMRPYQWYQDPSGKRELKNTREKVHLWDGGVCDNLAAETMYRKGRGLAKDIDYLLVSDASAPNTEQDWPGDTMENLLRIWDINANGTRSMMKENLNREIIKEGNGTYVSTGATVKDIVRACRIPADTGNDLIAASLTDEEAAFVRDYPTTLKTPSHEDYKLIFRHGYEIAKVTGHCGKDS